MGHLNISSSSISTLPGDSDEETDSDDDESAPNATNEATTNTFGRSAEEEDWHREAWTSLLNAMENNQPAEVANLELNGMRMTANANFHMMRRAIATSLVMRIEQVVTREAQSPYNAASRILKQWESTIKRAIFKIKDQSEFLLFAQRECVDRPDGPAILLNFTRVMNHDMDIVDEEAVNDWWNDERSKEGEKMASVRRMTEPYVTWLAEAESESEEESEEESEDDE